ncbi:sigma-70 family RNA polymerase sigma factor [Synechococcus sp. CS-1328]|uniref:sigma-70 family RNA polymerase sigma factor n=1 Tax=Synechococcus sp. CS-1328 TaxID=2847976 RepID=UPI00223C2396|nr:sigma-70 family RNA polymerase sigma factor [Synechococcus sp. CS-1328]MCT0225596.1 sigma-70 family RNA polymerase sigma factor [Synechococcus sp. CS-1328]
MHLPHPSTAPSVRDWLTSSSRHQPLAERTVIELSRRIQRWQNHPGGPSQAPAAIRRSALRARDCLVRHNLLLVAHTWSRHRHSLPATDEGTADAFQEAALNLLRAAEKFDPARGYRFSTYASFWVRRGFSELQQRQGRTIRFPAEKAAVVLKAQRLSQEHQASTGRRPSLAWLASQCRLNGAAVSEAALVELIRQWELTRTGALEGDGDDDTAPAGGRLEQASLRAAAEQQGEPSDPQRNALPQLMECLPPREQRLIRARYLRRPPLSPAQLRRALRIEESERQELEQQALSHLRQAAKQGHHPRGLIRKP